ncbi:MAG: HAD family hydrolase [Actinomycetota bacterium]|nr:HAD family hydrolase [Actinomycetota bacterium]
MTGSGTAADTAITMIATDLDGTLLGADQAVSERTVAALRAATAEGIHVVAATGRGWSAALPPLAPTGVIELAACSNGAVLYDVAAQRVDLAREITGDVARAAAEALHGAVDGVGFAWETIDGYGCDARFAAAHPEFAAITTGTDGLSAIDAAIKLFIGVDDLDGVAVQRLLEPLAPPTITISTSGAPFVEATAAGVDKASGLALIAERLGVDPTGVIAFGDQLNDVPMLRWAGRSVAMGNAHPEIAALCSEVTASHDRDGVAIVIERILEQR